MAENIQRNRGRGQGYKFDRGGTPAEFGPYIGVVKNNVDSLRAGRLQVYIEEFAGGNEEDNSLWRTVAYVPPFYGIVEQSGTTQGTGTYVGNPQSYGMWFTPPDIGTKVICFFASGDPNQGYYTGCVPELGVNHMIPAVGASRQFSLEGAEQQNLLQQASQLPVTEINIGNDAINENPKFYDQPKPVHSYLSAVLLQQGLITDNIRGPIASNSQRESPSTVYGISTPGRSVTQGGVNEENVNERANSPNTRLEDIKVVGRRGGHSIVMDDGDINGFDNLIRIRTSKGHQITMSDDGDCFYIIHANGQTWLEFGTEGTVDVYATNSVNIRTQGDLNLHADQNINMYAGEQVKIKSKNVVVGSDNDLQLVGKQLTLFSDSDLGIGTKGALNIDSQSGGWKSANRLSLRSSRIDLNGQASPASVSKPDTIEDVELPDVEFDSGKGWTVSDGKLTTIVTRAPTHEPYPYHNRGVEVQVQLDQGAAAPTVPGVGITPPAAAPSSAALQQLANQPVTIPVDPGQIIKQTAASDAIANLTISEVTSLLASRSAEVSQSPGAASTGKGVGKYGLTPSQLEQLGLIKTGTVSRYGSDQAVLTRVINSPTIWTGKFGIRTLQNLLDNEPLQAQLQQDLMVINYEEMQRNGAVSGLETSIESAALIQSAILTGPEDVLNWTKDLATAEVTARINAVSKNAQQAVNSVLSNPVLSRLGGLAINIAGVIGTVSRVGVDTAVVNVINNAKIPAPSFKPRERTGNDGVERIDISSIQRQARNQAISQALARGASEAQADSEGNAAGNLAGARALRRLT
jgi:hypothetical protein